VIKKKPFTVDDAYALETPDDSIRLYGEWADSYDSDFVAESGYILFAHVADQLLRNRELVDGPVLDVGCGTGTVGVCLREGGIEIVDGVDISAPMLAEASKKKTSKGDSVYRDLFEADLTIGLDSANDQYAAIVSAGTFTHGHLGPDPLDELWRVAAPGALCAIGVRTTHFVSASFEDKLAGDVATGKITEPDFVEVDLYSPKKDDARHSNDKAYVVVCRVVK
jgi:SAM-dependent methyltransferase